MRFSCKDCEKRFPGCAQNCEDYKAFREKFDEINRKRRQHDRVMEFTIELASQRKESFRKSNKK